MQSLKEHSAFVAITEAAEKLKEPVVKWVVLGKPTPEQAERFVMQYASVDIEDSEEWYLLPYEVMSKDVDTAGMSNMEVRDLAKRLAKEAIAFGATHLSSNHNDMRLNTWLAIYCHSGSPDYWTGESLEYSDTLIPFVFYMGGMWYPVF